MDDDLQQLGYGIIVYDALYRWRCDTQDETHPWKPPRTPALQSPRADTMSSLPLHYIKTIETHKSRGMDKLGLKSRAELMRYAIENQLLEA